MSAATPAERRPGVIRRVLAPFERAVILVLLGIIGLYQLTLSPIVGRQCRFEPTCSRYFAEALRVHGLPRGFGLGVWRICRCHPWGGQGMDPVPPLVRAGPLHLEETASARVLEPIDRLKMDH